MISHSMEWSQGVHSTHRRHQRLWRRSSWIIDNSLSSEAAERLEEIKVAKRIVYSSTTIGAQFWWIETACDDAMGTSISRGASAERGGEAQRSQIQGR